VYNYHHATLLALAELLAAAGLEHPQQLRPMHFSQRTSITEVQTFAKLYPSLRPGELIDGTSDPRFRDDWAMARAETFAAAGREARRDTGASKFAVEPSREDRHRAAIGVVGGIGDQLIVDGQRDLLVERVCIIS